MRRRRPARHTEALLNVHARQAEHEGGHGCYPDRSKRPIRSAPLTRKLFLHLCTSAFPAVARTSTACAELAFVTSEVAKITGSPEIREHEGMRSARAG